MNVERVLGGEWGCGGLELSVAIHYKTDNNEGKMGRDWGTRFTDDQDGAEKTYDYTHSYVLKGSNEDLNAKQFNNQYDIDKKEKVKHDTYRDIKEQAGGRIEFIPLVSSSHGRCSDKMKKLYSRLADSRLAAQGIDPKKGYGKRFKSIIMQQYWQEYAVAHFKGILLLLKGMSRLAQKQLRRRSADIRSTPISSATIIQPHQASSPTTVTGMSQRST